MKHVVFVTFELAPVTPGGAGVFIAGAVRSLVREGLFITVLADFPELDIGRARVLFEAENAGRGRVAIESVARLCGEVPPNPSVFRRNSERFLAALNELDRRHRIDLVEFCEYAGMGFASLREHRGSRWLSHAKLVVRAHGSLEFIDRAEGVRPDGAQVDMYTMEREALRLADAVLVPSAAIGRIYGTYYGLPPLQRLLSPPPMDDLLVGLAPRERLPDPGHFLFFGKLQEVKGCVQLAEAGVSLIAANPERHWRFTFIGRDTWCARHGRPTTACILEKIPESLREQFEFIPGINRDDLPRFARRPVAAVFPSRFETFCLAAHEVRACGVPLIVPDIPAFEDYLNSDTGCLTYDGSTSGLMAAIERVRDGAELRLALEMAPRPRYAPFAEAYGPLLDAAGPSRMAAQQVKCPTGPASGQFDRSAATGEPDAAG